jgi:hypothetical protein
MLDAVFQLEDGPDSTGDDGDNRHDGPHADPGGQFHR